MDSVTGNPVPTNRDTILSQWREAKKKFAEYQATERALRQQVVDAFSSKPVDFAGTENIDIGWGHQLKIVHSLDYKLDKNNDYEKTDDALDAIEKALPGGVGELITGRLVKRELSLSLTEYKLLPPEAKKIIDRVLTVTPASKSVEIKPIAGAAKS